MRAASHVITSLGKESVADPGGSEEFRLYDVTQTVSPAIGTSAKAVLRFNPSEPYRRPMSVACPLTGTYTSKKNLD